MADDFADYEGEIFLSEFRIELGRLCQLAQARHLIGLAGRVGRRQAVLGFEGSHLLSAAEALGQHVDDGGVDIVDAAAQILQCGHYCVFVQNGIPRALMTALSIELPRSWRD
jgi:hypothetical protein